MMGSATKKGSKRVSVGVGKVSPSTSTSLFMQTPQQGSDKRGFKLGAVEHNDRVI